MRVPNVRVRWRRESFVLWIILTGLTLCVAKAFYVQIIQRDRFVSRGATRTSTTERIEARRGRILDRNGVELAVSRTGVSVGAHPSVISKADWDAIGEVASSVAGVEKEAVIRMLEPGEPFVWIRRQIPVESAPSGLGPDLSAAVPYGLRVVQEEYRYYPQGENFCQITGFCGVDVQGLGGIEYSCREALRGIDGRRVLRVDELGRESGGSIQMIAPTVGSDIHLTVSRQAQGRVVGAMRQAAIDIGLRRASVVALDGGAGEVRALANYPLFDPNEFRRYVGSPDSVLDANDVVRRSSQSAAFDLLVLGTAALAAGTIGGDQPEGWEEIATALAEGAPVDRRKVRRVAQGLGAGQIASYTRSLGLGIKPKSGFEGERRGDVDAARLVASGQGIEATPLQMARVLGIISSEGRPCEVTILKRSPAPADSSEASEHPSGRVLLSGVARFVRDGLEAVGSSATNRGAGISGYRGGGFFWTGDVRIDGTIDCGYCGFTYGEPLPAPIVVVVTADCDAGLLDGAAGTRIREWYRQTVFGILQEFEGDL